MSVRHVGGDRLAVGRRVGGPIGKWQEEATHELKLAGWGNFVIQ